MKGIFTAMLLVFCFLIVDAQSKLDRAIDNLEKNYSQEKVYILFDKDQYVAGDQIFFQSFVFEGYSRSAISKTMFVELYDQSKNLIDKKTILINDGKASGTFNLNKTLNEDVYFVRAYTNWMANFDIEWNFIKPIPIYNPTSKKKIVLSENSKWTIEAFPEGGIFVDQVSTKVAVRLLTQGKSMKNWNGYVIDSEFPDHKIQTFKSLDENVALFSITPKFGKTYKVVVEDGEGNSQITTLQTVTNQGLNLKINSEISGIRYTIAAINLEKNVQNYTVVGTLNNQLAYKAKIKSANPKISSLIPTKEIGQNGVMQISLFDDKENLVAQRLCFLNQNSTNPIVLENSKFNNDPRALNSFEIKQNPGNENYTVVVKDLTDTNPASKENILSSLYLTEDFKNPIKNPAQYFSKDANPEALDALLISENWKRFDWTKLMAGQKPTIKYNLADNEFISYKARLALNSRPLPNTLVNLVFKNDDGEPLLEQFTTDSNGDLFINNLNFEDSYFVNYFLNTNDKQQVNLTLKLKLLIENNISKFNFPKTKYELKEIDENYILPMAIEKALANAQNNEKINQEETQIEEVKIIKRKSDAKKKLNDEITSGMFSSMNATVLDLVNENEDAQSYSNIMQWLQGRAGGLTFQSDNSGNLVPYIRGGRAGIYLNETKVDIEAVSSLSVSDVAMVKIFKDYGLVPNAVAIFTRTGSTIKEQKSKNISNKIEIKAYDKVDNFKIIDYSQAKYKSLINDTREVLYWNPKASSNVTFFNNESANNREITIISFDKNDQINYYNESVK
ncbi:hypothetical protein [Epilithonimonas xixisoli]|uniref:TonB-dependent receptor-like protein n=1 Tax=Epilithonimonas xixisoli TaxID=1476462 RepID=A0A4R8IA13_9FLAO|nr:hypothetical protein [Epilithonimonas xixisoli]TDX86504.1 hypothetical protein B0I22_0633 [Epilithonimonas xixisoli]